MTRTLRAAATALLMLASLVATGADNPVVIGNCRFTFITDGLVRLEYALDRQFTDAPTLFAQDRTPRATAVSVVRKGRNYTLSTPLMRVEYADDGFPFGQTNLHVFFKRSPHDEKEAHWYIASRQTANLKGAVTTLDEVSGPIPRQEGLLSRDGWYVIDDTGKELLRDGWFVLRDRSHVQDLYLFVYGEDYKAALRSLCAVSGPAPMPRKYVHGSWYCRWWNYTDEDYREIVADYRRHDFPLDILVFDMGWHTQDATVGTGHAGTKGWTGYTWNRNLIHDPARLIADLKKDSIAVVLNEHPHDGLRPNDDAYAGFIRELGADTTGGHVPLFDAGDRHYMEAFMKHAHAESEQMGIAFWWLDWQQDYLYPYVRGTAMRHLPWLNHLYYAHSQHDSLRGAGFSRWAGWGDHRHPIQFSGDAVANWELLRFEIDLTTSSGNAGCFFWAHDVGGFYGGTDPELYTRWTQFGTLTSSLRTHSVYDAKLDRRPWLWGKAEEQAMRRAYHLRSRLMPYIYSSVHRCYTDMLPLNRGLYIENPADEKAYGHPGQFLFGDILMAAPVTTPGKGEDKRTRQSVWFPGEGTWHHFFTGQRYDGGTTAEVESPLSEFPLFVRGGYPLPMQPYTARMATTPLTDLIVRCYPGEEGCDNSYELYEDDGLTTAYEHGSYATTQLQYRQHGGVARLTVHPATGTYSDQPKRRSYRFIFPGISPKAKVTVGGRKARACRDDETGGLCVVVGKTDIRKAVEVIIDCKGQSTKSAR